MVRRLESGRIASIGLQLDEILQVDPDERLLARFEEETDELRGLRRWLTAAAAIRQAGVRLAGVPAGGIGTGHAADVAEPVDAADLKSASFGSVGSSPTVRTI